MADEPDDTLILHGRVRVPEHVVYRDFADETVVLNLETGMYHGLNTTAAKMLATLDGGAPVDTAIGQLAEEFEQPREVIERDVLDLCSALHERGLITYDAGAAAS